MLLTLCPDMLQITVSGPGNTIKHVVNTVSRHAADSCEWAGQPTGSVHGTTATAAATGGDEALRHPGQQHHGTASGEVQHPHAGAHWIRSVKTSVEWLPLKVAYGCYKWRG